MVEHTHSGKPDFIFQSFGAVQKRGEDSGDN